MIILCIIRLNCPVKLKFCQLFLETAKNRSNKKFKINMIVFECSTSTFCVMVPLEQVQSNDPWILLSREKYYIRKFDPVLNIRM